MILLSRTLVFSLLAVAVYGQQAPVGVHDLTQERPLGKVVLTPEQVTEQMISNLIASGSPVKLHPARVHRMGDGAAQVIARILATRDPFTPQEQQAVLDIIHIAYEKPLSIMTPALLKPDATYALLDQIDASALDPVLRIKVSETRTFVLNNASR